MNSSTNSNDIVLVKYTGTNSFIEINSRAFAQTNGNFGQNQYYYLTFPLDRNGDTFLTGLTKDEAEKLEDENGLEKGSLMFRSKFLQDFKTPFNKAVPTVLNKALPDHKIILACLKANSLTRSKTAVLAEKDKIETTLLVVRDDIQETKDDLSKLEVKRKAYKVLEGLSSIDLRNLLLSRGEVGIESLADERISLIVQKLLDQNPSEFLRLSEEIKDSTKVDVQQMLHLGILKRNGEGGRKIMISDTDDVIGVGIEDATDWFKDTNNAKEVIRLKNKLQNLKSKK